VADLNVVVHVGCFDRLFGSEGPRSWSTERRAGGRDEPKERHDEPKERDDDAP
jgi:hypothetical protein